MHTYIHIHIHTYIHAHIQVDSEFERKWDKCEDMRYMDTRIDEQQRKLGIKGMPVTLLMPNSKGKSYASES